MPLKLAPFRKYKKSKCPHDGPILENSGDADNYRCLSCGAVVSRHVVHAAWETAHKLRQLELKK